MRKEVKEQTIRIKNNEKRFSALYENALIALLSTDANEGFPVEVNNAVVNMLECPKWMELELHL